MASALVAPACGGSAFDQCEVQRENYHCGTTTHLLFDCSQFKNKTCNTASMDRWLTCQRAAHVCRADMTVDISAYTASSNACGLPDCVAAK